MAVNYMKAVNIDIYDKNKTNKAFEYEDVLNAIAIGNWIIIPNNIKAISTQLVFTGTATAKVQYTCSPLVNIIAGTAIANDSVAGAKSVNTFEKFDTVSAIRLNVTAWTSGTVKLQLRAQ
jgi:hypothetical protein